MSVLAESSTALSRLQTVPTATWLKLGGAVVALILVVIVLRKAAKTNKVVMGVAGFVILTFIGFNWVYQRNEPSWATPVVEKLAPFFPSQTKQANRVK